ncbi:MAG: polysaccharide biosynthesis/export family protein [Acidobacteriaceae bacterium]
MTCSVRAQFNGPAPGSKTGINQPVNLTTDPTLLNATLQDFKFSPGDLLTVHVYGVSDFNLSFRVSADGSVQLPLIGIVPVQGLSIRQTEDLIAKKLADDGMVRNPQVTVEVTESPNQVATVMGEVNHPSVVPILGSRRLLDVLTAAGGLSPAASHTITIRRKGVNTPITVDLGSDPIHSQKANIFILPGDTVMVPRIGVVYMLGAFKAQGIYPLNPNTPLTLMQAIAMAGGVGYQGKLKDARIIRTIGTERKEVQVNVGKIISGKEADPVLLSDDIVMVPTSTLKAAIKSGGFGVAIGIAYALQYYTR